MGYGYCLKTCFRSTHIVEEHLFSMFPSNIIFNFDLIYRFFLAFWAQMCYLGGRDFVKKKEKKENRSTHKVQQLCFLGFL